MKVGTFVIVSIVAFTSVYFVATHNRPNPQTRHYSQAQWMQMITKAEHQPTTILEGSSDSYITKTGASSSGGGLRFQESQARILEFQARDLLEKDPLYFWLTLESDDKRILQTGLYIYDRFLFDNSDEMIRKLCAVYRKLLDYKDIGLKKHAIYKLHEYSQFTVSDIEKGLADSSSEVRFDMSISMDRIFGDHLVYTKDGKIHKGSVARANELLEIKRKLAPIFLQRINDPRISTRCAIARDFYSMFKRHELHESGGSTQRIPDFFPEKIDWRRASWQKCEETKEIWTKWWAENGEEALKFAHPPQK